MRYLFGFMCVCALGVVPILGCSDTEGAGGSGGAGGEGGSAGMGGGGGEAGSNGEPASQRWFITTYEPPIPVEAREGVRICELDTDNCVVTDAEGYATLEGLTAGRETAVTLDREGMVSYLEMFVPRAPIPLGCSAAARFEEMYQLMDAPWPMEGTGSIYMFGLPVGSTITLIGGPGKRFYTENDPGRTWNPDRTGASGYGGGGFVELAPGDYQVEVGTSKSCTTPRAWPGDSENTVRMPVREGYTSSALVHCL